MAQPAVGGRRLPNLAEQARSSTASPLTADGHVNVSPRGHDTVSILGQHRVGWVDDTGSGVETIAHLRENGRVCVMFCSFDARPRVVRVHGTGRVALPAEPDLMTSSPGTPSDGLPGLPA